MVGWVNNVKGPFAGSFYINVPTLSADSTYLGQNHHLEANTGCGPMYEDNAPFCLQGWTFRDWTGVSHAFNGYDFCGGYSLDEIDTPPRLNATIVFSTDGAGYELDLRNPNDLLVRGPDGTVYHFPPGPPDHGSDLSSRSTSGYSQFNAYANVFTKIVDTNGNTITAAHQLDTGAYLITDTMGRQITLGGGGGSLSWQEQPSPTGTEQTRTVSLSQPTFSGTTTNFPTTDDACVQKPVSGMPDGYTGPNITFEPGPTLNTATYQTLTLQDGTTYKFTLNALGQLARIDYPTGGYTRYDYAVVGSTGQIDQGDMMCTKSWRSVIAKHVCTLASGGCTPSAPISTPDACQPGVSGGEETTCYDGWAGPYYWESLTETDPLAVQTVHNFTLHAGPQGPPSNDYVNPDEEGTTVTDASGKLLRTMQVVPNPDGSSCGYPLEISMGVNIYPIWCSRKFTQNDVSPAVSTTETTNWWLPGVPQSTTTRDFSGNVIRTVTNQFESSGIYALADNNSNQTMLTNILDHIQSTTRTDAVTNLQTTSTNTYDAVGNLIQIDTTATNAANTTTTYTRNSFGDVIRHSDPMQVAGQHTGYTSMGYDVQNIAGCPQNPGPGLPTSVTDALGHTTLFSYYDSGRKACVQDPNNQITRISYDPLGRLAEADMPDGGKTTVAYTTAPPLTSTVTVLQGTTSKIVTDGFGRATQSILDPSGQNICVETFYDAVGNVGAVNDPRYGGCAGSILAGASKSYLYDALSRKKSQTNEDGTTLQWSYSGPTTVFTDEAGHQWQRTSDALSRLIKVLEPSVTEPNIGTGTPETDYTYDGFDNLLSVTQKGIASETARSRSFTYDGLSQLLTAANPETGTVTYSYDLNGNLHLKTDARGIWTQFAYDALNRLTDKYFNDGPNQTPNQHFQYDQTSVWMGTQYNTIGRLSRAYTDRDMRYFGSGTAPACVPYSSSMPNYNPANGNPTYCEYADELYSYDSMGRANRIGTAFPSEVGWAAHEIDMSYNLAGNMTSLRYPDGRVTTEGFDTAGRLSNVSFDNWNGTHVGYNYLTMDPTTPYFPDGSPEKMTFGNGAIETFTKNNRLQPTEIKLQANASGIANQTIFDKQYNYTSSCQSANNGNIMQILQVAPMSSGDSQGFCYDSVNRISSFSNGSGTMQQSYTYDSFGNVSQSGTLNSQLTFDANNRITSSGYGQDAAGNVTSFFNPVTTTTSTASYDAESKIFSNSAGGYYTYDAAGERMRKDAGGSYTEYQYLNGQPIAEKNSDGTWSDYIYANGQKIARADSFDSRLHSHGTCGSTSCIVTWSIPTAGGYTIKAGDMLMWRQYQSGGGQGGLDVTFTDGTQTAWNLIDTAGQSANAMTTQNQWVSRSANLSASANKIVLGYFLFTNNTTPAGTWDIYTSDIAIVSKDGTVTSIYARQPGGTLPLYYNWMNYGTNLNASQEISNSGTDAMQPQLNTTYYQGDQIGSSRLLTSAGGWPVESYTFYPFGQDAAPSANPNHYKFAGKERDAESGLDYFGARYFSSSMGRMMSPDWSAKAEPVPYAKLSNPQSLNLYSYVGNNPLSRTDPTGHYEINCGNGVKNCAQQQTNVNNAIAAGLKSKDQSVVQAARAYGALGEKNGVTVSVVNVVDPKNANVTGNTGAQAGTGGIQSTDGGKTFMQATQVNIQAGLSANQLSDTTVHEGQHVADRENFITALGVDQSGKLVQGLNITHSMSEVNAYGVENANRGQRGEAPRDIDDILAHPPYSTNPDINKPLFPDFPSPY